MGSINGSAVANVVTTGTFTIPLMKKVGYRPEFAGAVEAVASTGGQLLPPVMGAAAFVMADLTGIPYSTIIIAAIVPGILYYLSLGVSVYLEADKQGLQAESADKLPQVKKVLKEGWYYALPIIVLIVALLGFGLSANFAALFSIAVLLVIGFAKEWLTNKRLPFKEVFNALVKASKTTVSVTVACACAGIVIGIVSMTGIGIKFTSIVFKLSGGHLVLMLLLVMLACIIMGMGLPSTAAYIIAATVGVPSLTAAGIPELAANLFVFYFAIMSFITPPVAVAAYAAAGLADSSTSKTGWLAFMLGLPGFTGFESNCLLPTELLASRKGAPWLDMLMSYYDGKPFVRWYGRLNDTPNTLIISKIFRRRGFGSTTRIRCTTGSCIFSRKTISVRKPTRRGSSN